MTHPYGNTGRVTVPGPRSASPQSPGPDYPIGRRARAVGYAVLALLGAVVGLAGTFVQPLWVPGGLLLALGGLTALCCGGRVLTGTRAGAAIPALGWFLMLMVAQAPRPEGDFLLEASLSSYVFLLGGMLIGVICATVRTLPRLTAPPSSR
jgi:hypothetical protein